MTDYFALCSTLNQAMLPAAQEARLLYLLVEIAPNPQLPIRRAPVNLALVVDASDSMRIPALDDDLVEELARRGLLLETETDGIPVFKVLNMPADLLARADPVCSMDFVQQALGVLVDRLAPDDRISLVAFAGHAETLISNRTGQERRKILEVLDTLDSGQFGDDTCLAAGLRMALQEAQRGHTPDRLSRLLLLTDGFAVDEPQAMAVATQIAAGGFTLSTVGLGLAFNEGFLIGLAELSGGNAHMVFRPAEIPGVFAAELEATQKVVLRGVDLRLALASGVAVRRAYRVVPVLSELALDTLHERSLTFALGDLERDQSQSVLLELLIPPRPAGAYRIAQIVATGAPTQRQNERALARSDVLLQITPAGRPLPPANARVMALVERLGTFKLQTRALADAANGDIAGATRKLQAAVTRLLADGETEMATTVEAEIANLTEQGQMSAAGTKKLRYETRKLTQKLG